ncbi:MAG: hypothetical protein BM556_14910 [Bacteriovorax sp. MedPE-SWde]|nr:MAG: hypothetical protein BM556_14910 [Bacteriovorax sp. MedPE-SWde]
MSVNATQRAELNSKITNLQYLILDPKEKIKSVTINTLTNLGVKEENIHSTKTIEESLTFLQKNKPSYLACFIETNDKEIFKLIDKHKSLIPNNFERFFLAFSLNKAIYTFAQALEEDIDDYIVEPYDQTKLLKKIEKTLINKTFPSQYKYILNEIKVKTESKDYAGAQAMAHVAQALHPRPSMVYYYLAKIQMSESNNQEAISLAIQGLRFNKDHYKCLLILHDLYFEEENYDKAYKVLKKVFKTFPLSMVRIYDMFRLAILSGKFVELEKYCTKILDDESNNIDIVRFCASGITVCALDTLKKGSEIEGVSLLTKALKYSQNDPKILRNIFKTFAKFELYNNSENTYAKFSVENEKTPEFRTCAYIREIQSNKPIEMIINEAATRLEGVEYDSDCIYHLHKKIKKEASTKMIQDFESYARSMSLIL